MTEFTISADGTRIAYDRVGDGHPVVLVGGAFQQRAGDESTAELARLLGERGFSAVHYDRRGRGESGPVRVEDAGQELQREIEDLAAVISAVGGEAALFGNSSGGAIALWAADAGIGVTRVIAFEVPIAVDDDGEAAAFAEELRELIVAGHDERAVEHFMKDMPPAWLEGAKSSGAWQGMVKVAPSLVADAAAIAVHDSDRDELWSRVPGHVSVLVGEQTLPIFPPAAHWIAETLPEARTDTIAAEFHQWQPRIMADAIVDALGW